MNKNEIKQHERYKQMSLYSYDINKHQLPQGAELIGIAQNKNGYYAAVIRDDKEIVIAIRGTEGKLLREKENVKDILNDVIMPIKKPIQSKNALETVDVVKDLIKNNPEYTGCKITVIGHSLGGSLAQITAVLKGVKAVTFNAFGTKHLLEGKLGLSDIDITNYCNPKDVITTANAANHIGVCYEVQSVYVKGKFAHNLESMEPLENRVRTTGESLQQRASIMKRKMQEFEYYIKTGKHMPIRMPSIGYYGDNCAGSYPVSDYIRKDGTYVSGYTRTCGAKHLK